MGDPCEGSPLFDDLTSQTQGRMPDRDRIFISGPGKTNIETKTQQLRGHL